MEEIPLLKGTTEDLKLQTHLDSTLAQLSNTKRKKFRKLYNAFPEQNEVGIVRTNCYALGCNTTLSGVFEKLSRLNHSCRPNSERWWDPEREVETLYALRNIEANEEITISYSGRTAGMSQSARQNLTSKAWRFDCNCDCCQLTGFARESSDEHRELIGMADDMVGFNPARRMVILIKKALECMDKEGLLGSFKARICYDGYQLALQTRDLREAKSFIRMCYDQYLLGTGPNSQETRKMLGYVQDPTSHIEWSLYEPAEEEENDDDNAAEDDDEELLQYIVSSMLADL